MKSLNIGSIVVDVERRIFMIRGARVMLSFHLAELYEVEPRVLIQALKRHRDRFPSDFMFQLSKSEYSILRSQNVILKKGRGRHLKYLPYAFTEQGVAMLSGVLNSPRAVRVNIAVMRAFVRMRALIASNADLSNRLNELEKKYDAQFHIVFDAIRKIICPQEPSKSNIGFKP